GTPGFEEGTPEGRRVVPGAEDLDAVLPRVPGARGRARDPAEDGVAEVERLELAEPGPVVAELRQDLHGARPLDGDEGGLVALVLEVAVVLRGVGEMGADLVAVRGV